MKTIKREELALAVRDLFIRTNCQLPGDLKDALNSAASKESGLLARGVLCDICDNFRIAEERSLPVCQDTGMAVLFVEIGRDVHLDCNFEEAICEGVRRAYTEGYLRCSVVADPLYRRVNTGDNTPPVIHTRLTEGDSIRIVAAPKGFGSENMSRIRMFTPSAGEDDLVSFVCSVVKEAGGNPCPPLVVGVGIGGDFEYAPYLAKKALTRSVSERHPDPAYARLEKRMLDEINALGVGPQGFGGVCTALAVNIETYATHIAGLPVAVNIGCHVTRHGEAIL